MEKMLEGDLVIWDPDIGDIGIFSLPSFLILVILWMTLKMTILSFMIIT